MSPLLRTYAGILNATPDDSPQLRFSLLASER
jgi:hypothetical protein